MSIFTGRMEMLQIMKTPGKEDSTPAQRLRNPLRRLNSEAVPFIGPVSVVVPLEEQPVQQAIYNGPGGRGKGRLWLG